MAYKPMLDPQRADGTHRPATGRSAPAAIRSHLRKIPEREPPCAPFIKWAGGKRQLLPFLLERVPPLDRARYHEPFIGGGALFFALRREGRLGRRGARLADKNPELINAYVVVRDSVDALVRALSRHTNDEDHFYRVRALDPRGLDKVERAARLIYLNKTCYNGLFRENSRGEFNVPFGRYARPRILCEESLRAASAALQGTAIEHAPFESVAEEARRGDFVYFDPPYVPVSRTASFVSYSAGGFDDGAQARLAGLAAALAARGVNVLLSNSSARLVRALYDGFLIEEVLAARAINSRAQGRGKIPELLVSAGPYVGIATRPRRKPEAVAPQGIEPRTLRV